MTPKLRQSGQDKASQTEPGVDYLVFIPALLVVLICAVPLIFRTKATAQIAQQAMAATTGNFGWLYLAFGLGALVFAMWLAFGRYGRVKLGPVGEGPEYSNFHWISMMFTAGIGAGLVVWGFAEAIYYLDTPPLDIEPGTSAAIEMAHMYPMFHWGIAPWAIYAMPAVPIAYMLYVKQTPQMRMSHACDGVLPLKGRRAIKRVIDIFIILGVIGGAATSLGLGVPLVSAFISEFSGVSDSILIKMGVLLVWVLLFGASAYRGLKRGIKILADINMAMGVLAIIFILVSGPTVYILSITVNSVGLLFENFARASLWTDPVDKGGFPESWTIFYWAWWLSYGGMVGLFFGRISRGRTIRQLLLGVICWGTLGTWTFLAVASAYALHVETQGIVPALDLLKADNAGMSVMVAKILASLPFGKLTLLAFIILSIIFYATTMDSAAFVLAGVCAKDMKNDEEPRRSNRLVWAGLIALLSAGILMTGNLDTVKAATVLTSLPLIPIFIMMGVTTVRWLKQDFDHLVETPELALARKDTESNL